MTLSTLTITITDTRLIDGWVEAANRNGTTPELLALEFLKHQGRIYADLNRIGLITSSGFIRRFSAAEYGAILAAAEQSPQVAALVATNCFGTFKFVLFFRNILLFAICPFADIAASS